MEESLQEVGTLGGEVSGGDGYVVVATCTEGELEQCVAALLGCVVVGTHGLLNVGVGQIAAESVGAEDEGGVWLGGEGGDFWLGGTIDITQRMCDDVVVGVGECLLGGNLAVVDELLHVGVVVGEGTESILGCVGVASAVATPCHVCLVGEHPCEDDGGAHADGVEVVDDVLVDCLVGLSDGLAQQLGGSLWGGGCLGGCLGGEGLRHGLKGDG